MHTKNLVVYNTEGENFRTKFSLIRSIVVAFLANIEVRTFRPSQSNGMRMHGTRGKAIKMQTVSVCGH